ncbi:MAG: ABC transporter ATP-binding protein [Alistipes sp.]|nr:ABC transporter ATP-binding protein [Alistipes sp.]
MKNRLWQIIPRHFRRRAITVAVTIFVRALLNFIGIAMMVPVLMLILDSESVTSNEYLGKLYNLLDFSTYAHFVVVVCIAVIAIIITKNIAVILLYRFERDYIYALYKYLSEKLYLGYRYRGLGYIKRNNSAILTRNINVVTLTFVAGILKPIASIVSEALLLLLMFAALLWYTPTAALLAIVVFVPSIALFYLGVRRRLNDIGVKENEAQRVKSRVVAETFRGYADIEIGGAFPQMFKRFENAMNEAIALRKRNATIAMLPQMFTEVGLVLGMVTLVLLSLSVESYDIGLMFGVFAVAAIRLIPSIRNIMSNWSAIRYNRYSIDVLSEADLDDNTNVSQNSDERFNFSRSIELCDISFTYEDSTTPTIENLSLTINKGERIGIKGASGSGKTTLFNLILGLYHPSSGYIAVDGEKLDCTNIRKWQNSIGYVSQNVFIADMTLAENIALGCEDKDIDYNRINKVIELADLKKFIDSLPNGIHSRIGEQGCRLSGGQRQRIGIARALYKNCDVLFFDEATSSLDSQTEENINNAIRRLSDDNRSLTIIVIAHRESSLEYCDRIITIE